MRIRRSLWKLNLVLCYFLLAQLVFTIDPPPPGTVQSLAGPSSVTTATQNTTDGNPVLAAATVNPIPNPSDGSVSTVDANANTNTAPSASVANTANEVGTNRIENTNVVNTNDALETQQNAGNIGSPGATSGAPSTNGGGGSSGPGIGVIGDPSGTTNVVLDPSFSNSGSSSSSGGLTNSEAQVLAESLVGGSLILAAAGITGKILYDKHKKKVNKKYTNEQKEGFTTTHRESPKQQLESGTDRDRGEKGRRRTTGGPRGRSRGRPRGRPYDGTLGQTRQTRGMHTRSRSTDEGFDHRPHRDDVYGQQHHQMGASVPFHSDVRSRGSPEQQRPPEPSESPLGDDRGNTDLLESEFDEEKDKNSAQRIILFEQEAKSKLVKKFIPPPANEDEDDQQPSTSHQALQRNYLTGDEEQSLTRHDTANRQQKRRHSPLPLPFQTQIQSTFKRRSQKPSKKRSSGVCSSTKSRQKGTPKNAKRSKLTLPLSSDTETAYESSSSEEEELASGYSRIYRPHFTESSNAPPPSPEPTLNDIVEHLSGYNIFSDEETEENSEALTLRAEEERRCEELEKRERERIRKKAKKESNEKFQEIITARRREAEANQEMNEEEENNQQSNNQQTDNHQEPNNNHEEPHNHQQSNNNNQQSHNHQQPNPNQPQPNNYQQIIPNIDSNNPIQQQTSQNDNTNQDSDLNNDGDQLNAEGETKTKKKPQRPIPLPRTIIDLHLPRPSDSSYNPILYISEHKEEYNEPSTSNMQDLTGNNGDWQQQEEEPEQEQEQEQEHDNYQNDDQNHSDSGLSSHSLLTEKVIKWASVPMGGHHAPVSAFGSVVQELNKRKKKRNHQDDENTET